MDETRFPHLVEYLAKLPAGLDSYPECLTKGALLRSSLDGVRFHPSWASLPPRLRSALEVRPLPTEWISTVLTDSVSLVIVDTYFPTTDAMTKWNYDRTLQTANLPIYRMLTRVAGLPSFLRGAVKMHGFFQRGTDIRIKLAEGQADLRLEHPPHLHGRLNHMSNEAVFRALLDAAGAREASVLLLESTPTFARYRARWQT